MDQDRTTRLRRPAMADLETSSLRSMPPVCMERVPVLEIRYSSHGLRRPSSRAYTPAQTGLAAASGWRATWLRRQDAGAIISAPTVCPSGSASLNADHASGATAALRLISTLIGQWASARHIASRNARIAGQGRRRLRTPCRNLHRGSRDERLAKNIPHDRHDCTRCLS